MAVDAAIPDTRVLTYVEPDDSLRPVRRAYDPNSFFRMENTSPRSRER